MREWIGLAKHILRYDMRNFKGRIFVVSDLHGHYDLLHEALRNVGFNSATDFLFVLGDWTDRGPDSRYVLDYVNEPWIGSLQGNHEKMYMDGFESHWHPNNRSVQTLKTHGGDWIWNSGLTDLDKILINDAFAAMPIGMEVLLPNGMKVGMIHAEVPYNDWNKILINDAFAAMPIGMEVLLPNGMKVGMIHAEVPYNDWNKFLNMSTTELEWDGLATAQWSRRWYQCQYEGLVKNVDLVFVGHTPTDSSNVEQLGNMVFIDGGSFFNEKINLVEMNDEFLR